MFNVARPRVPGLLFALVFAGAPAGPANLLPSRVSSLTTAVAMAEPVKIGGVWKFTVELEIGTGHPTVTLKQDGEKLTGTYDGRYGAAPLEGTIKENKIEFTVSMTAEGAAVTGVFSGVVEGDKRNKACAAPWTSTRPARGTWTAVRAAAK